MPCLVRSILTETNFDVKERGGRAESEDFEMYFEPCCSAPLAEGGDERAAPEPEDVVQESPKEWQRVPELTTELLAPMDVPVSCSETWFTKIECVRRNIITLEINAPVTV